MQLTHPTTVATVDPEPTDSSAAGIPVLEMVQPLAGFPDDRRFALARLDDTGPGVRPPLAGRPRA